MTEDQPKYIKDIKSRLLGIIGITAGLTAVGLQVEYRFDHPAIEQQQIDILRQQLDKLGQQQQIVNYQLDLNFTGDLVNENILRNAMGADTVSAAEAIAERVEWKQMVKEREDKMREGK